MKTCMSHLNSQTQFAQAAQRIMKNWITVTNLLLDINAPGKFDRLALGNTLIYPSYSWIQLCPWRISTQPRCFMLCCTKQFLFKRKLCSLLGEMDHIATMRLGEIAHTAEMAICSCSLWNEDWNNQVIIVILFIIVKVLFAQVWFKLLKY